MKPLTISLIVFFSSIAFAEKFEGYYVSASNDTFRVKIEVQLVESTFGERFTPNVGRLRRKLIYYDSNNIKKKLRPVEVKEYFFTYESNEYLMVSRKRGGKRSFFRLKEGYKSTLKLLIYYRGCYRDKVSGEISIAERQFLQKKEEALFKLQSFAYRRRLMNYLDDCPTFSERMKRDNYFDSNIREIISEYNADCNR